MADTQVTDFPALVTPAASDFFHVIDVSLNLNKIITFANLQAAIAIAPSQISSVVLLADGSVGLSSDWDAGSHKVQAEQLESDIATGTAPLIVASSTLVANLNADMVDGVQGAEFLQRDGSVALTGNLAIGSNRITGLATPTSDTDAANKSYVDNAIEGLAWKDAVRVATTADGTLSSDFENGDTVDGVSLATGNRILLKDQSTAAENGIYIVNASGAPSRSDDLAAGSNGAGAAVFVEEGTTNGDTQFVCTSNSDAATVGTHSLSWSTYGSGGGGGESNTASNVNVGGTGVFKQKSGVNLEFYGINAASSKITVTLDAGNNEIDLDIGSVAITELSDVASKSGTGTAVLFQGSPVLTTPQVNDTSSDHQYVFAVSELAANRTVTLPLLTGNDTFVFESHTQTLANKTINTAANTITVVEADISDLGTYLPADGSVGLSSNWDAGSHKIQAEQLESDIATGTAPLVVASSTLVANLNADMVDGIQGAEFLQRDGSVALTGNLAIGANRITGLATPTSDTDAANKSYVDNAIEGLAWKDAVRVATTGAGTLSSDFENGDSIDGVSLTTGNRILLKNQSSGSENGIYVVNASGSPTRADDLATGSNGAGAALFVEEGTTNGDTQFICTSNSSAATVGTHALSWSTYGSGGGGGESNTASNVNVGGTGVFKQKSGVNLEFYGINAASSKITVTLDAGNNEIDLDIGSVAITELSDVASKSGTGTAVLFQGSPVLTTPQVNDISSDHQYVFAVSELAANRTVTLPLLAGNDTFVFEAHTQTLTNKTIDTAANTITVVEADISDLQSYLLDVISDTTPQLGGMLDVNGNALGDGTLELLRFVETGAAVNEITVTNAATGNGPSLSATGDDANVDLNLTAKGTGAVVSTTEAKFDKEAHFGSEVDNGNSGTADTIDWGEGNKQESTLTGNVTLTFTAPAGACNLMLKLTQDATGSRTVTWPGTVKWPGGTAPTLTTTANAVDLVSFYFDGTNYYGQAAKAFS